MDTVKIRKEIDYWIWGPIPKNWCSNIRAKASDCVIFAGNIKQDGRDGRGKIMVFFDNCVI
jgi:hypothetical protein